MGSADLTPAGVAAKASLDGPEELVELADRQLAYWVWRLLDEHPDHHFLATFDGRLYVYERGVWVPEGEQRLREKGGRMLGPEYGTNVHNELVELVRSYAGHRREELGTPPRTVTVENGLLHLTKRKTYPHRPVHKALNRIPHKWDADAECPKWQKFIEESVEEGKQAAVQEYVGYALLAGEMPFARTLLLVGGGSNGKSTFLNTVVKLLGEGNVTGFSLGNLSHNEYYAAEMYGALANIDADVTGGIGHGGMFKKLTGGDRSVNARRPYGEPFSFHPTTKQLYSANEVPDTKVDDDAFFRRWLIVEFPVEFTDDHLPGPDKNTDLEGDLEKELPGILNWAVEGLNRLLENQKFTGEGEIHEKRARWKQWGDTVDQFIAECVDPDGEGKHKAGDVHRAYVQYCREELDESPESQSTLTNTLKKESGVSYSSDYRFKGKKARGFKGFSLDYDVADDEEGEPSTGQQSLSQSRGYEHVRNAIEDLSNGSELADVEAVLEEVGDRGLDRDRAEHFLNKMREKGQVQEPEAGKVGLA